MAVVLKKVVGVAAGIALLATGCSSEEPAAAPETPATSTPEPSETPEPEPTPTDVGPTFTAEEQEVVDVFESAFDPDPAVSSVAYAPDPELEGILQAAAAAAAERGDVEIGAKVTAVTIDGDSADVAFDIIVGGNALARATGLAVRIDGSWKVHVSTLCGLLGIASPPPDGCNNVTVPE